MKKNFFNYLNLSLYLCLSLVLLTTCDLFDNSEPKPLPPGCQYDIPWPSLDGSPWPMLHRNPQAIGRGDQILANLGQIKWEFNFSELGEDLVSGVVVGTDSSIYFVTEMHFSAGLYCVDHSGNQKWKVELGAVHRYTTPIITVTNNILVLDYDTLRCFNNNGILLWSYGFDSNIFWWLDSPQIDKHGNIYLLDNLKNLYKISANGNLQWTLNNSYFRSAIGQFGMSFAPDGETLYIPGDDVLLVALNVINKEIKWVYGEQSRLRSPIVDSDGNIYCQLNDRIVALDPNGQLIWEFRFNQSEINDNKLILDKNGNFFFASKDSLYSLDFYGKLRWNVDLSSVSDSYLNCDQEGNLYVVCLKNNITMMKYNNLGKIDWSIDFITDHQYYSWPLISYDNTIILPTIRKIFAIN